VGSPETGAPKAFVELRADAGTATRTGEDPELPPHVEGLDLLDEETEMDCSCDTYECQCMKNCFCRIGEEEFGGTTVPRLKVVEESEEGESKGGDDDDKGSDDPRERGLPENQFMCKCSMEAVAAGALMTSNTMDCDCKVADCACQKKCLCRPKKGSAA
jgi:hypothetical protein